MGQGSGGGKGSRGQGSSGQGSSGQGSSGQGSSGQSGGNPNWPSTTGNPSGGGRGNAPPKK